MLMQGSQFFPDHSGCIPVSITHNMGSGDQFPVTEFTEVADNFFCFIKVLYAIVKSRKKMGMYVNQERLTGWRFMLKPTEHYTLKIDFNLPGLLLSS
jgi:hypothetical protein